MLSKSEENYIKEIYSLQEEMGKEVSTSLIAEKLYTKASSVTDMLQKLANKDLVIYKKYKGVKLNSLGKVRALSIIRKHRLWETFLVDVLHFNWDEVHEIAEQLEHIKSEKLVAKLDEFLGFPTVDPHGDPIPDVDGVIPNIKAICLTHLGVSDEGVFISVKDSSEKFLNFLNNNNLTIGCKIKVNHIEEFDNSMSIEINGIQLNISENVAKNIYLKSS